MAMLPLLNGKAVPTAITNIFGLHGRTLFVAIADIGETFRAELDKPRAG